VILFCMTLDLQRNDIHVLAPLICLVASSVDCHAAAAFGVASAAL